MANFNLNHHVPTFKEQRIAELRFACNLLMEEAAVNEHWCNEQVGGGQQAWRIHMTRQFRQLGLMVNDRVCDLIFEWLCKMVRHRYRAQMSALTAQAVAKLALDNTEQITPPTPEQIVDDLEIDSGGTSDDGRRAIYGRDGAAEIEFQKLKDELKENLKKGGMLPYREREEAIH